MLSTEFMGGNKISKSFMMLLTVFGLLIGFSSLAAADTPEINSLDIVDKVDNDGDGYISDFAISVNADTHINEKGEIIENGGIYTKFGEPWVGIYFAPKDASSRHDRPDMYKGMKSSSSTNDFKIQFDYSKMKSRSNRDRAILDGESINSFRFQYLESDSTWDDKDLSKDEVMEKNTVKILDNLFKIESPSNDQKGDVAFNSNPSGAEVYVDGEMKGETPFTVQMPVDLHEREGALNVKVEKDGYQKVLKKEIVNPSDQLSYDLKKLEKPLVVGSNVEDATVKINGQKIGETPVKKNYWIKQDLDVTVEKDGYEDKNFGNIKTPESIDVSFNTSSNDANTINYDLVNSLDYGLVNNLPDLNSMFQAKFNASTKKVKTGETASFDASPSYDIINNITSYKWSVEGQSVGSGEDFKQSFSSPGNYTVNLTVTNTQGTEAYETAYVMVENRLPEPKLSANTKVKQNQPVKLDASNSKDEDGSIMSYEWKIDGKVVSQSNSEELTHTFKTSGDHQVEVTVTDSVGGKKTVKKTVTVEQPNLKPSASFTPSSKKLETGETVSLDASGSTDSDGQIQTFAWNLGDGMSKTGQKISYNYSQPGTYKIELNVVDTGNTQATATKTITVTGEPKQQNSQKQNNDSKKNQNETSDNSTSSSEQKEGENSVKLLIDFLKSLF